MIQPRSGSRGGMGRTITSTILSVSPRLDEFKWFIEEREKIRKKKERGEDRPWTTDEILDKSRFTNIYRQHDKVSQFVFDKVGHLEGPLLVYNLLLSRLINRVDVLSRFLPTIPTGNLSFLLEGDPAIMNATAYQVAPGMVNLDEFSTNRETIIHYPKKVYNEVYDVITSTVDIKEAVEIGNKAFGGYIPFVMLQVVLDYHYLTGHYNDDSEIPVGQGAKVVVDALGGLDILSYELGMQKYDVEHAACEYRKYLYRKDKQLNRYSYVPNSMGV